MPNPSAKTRSAATAALVLGEGVNPIIHIPKKPTHVGNTHAGQRQPALVFFLIGATDAHHIARKRSASRRRALAARNTADTAVLMKKADIGRPADITVR
ncbi:MULTISPECIES: hypothetical protein [Ralstonia]|jgi:hypothetical protein|uniref:hypothetical protein n=1 Tax=Ralstonia TaxID=48736 RepID=UPI0018EE175E|nr:MULTISPECIES: hypothetical protein [unclassified Ralstonia]